MYKWVGVVLVSPDGKVLAQHRDNNSLAPSPDKWGICGGKVEKTDASLVYAAARELYEETGYLQDPSELKALAEDEFYTAQGLVTRIFYWAIYDETQPIECFEGQAIKFLDKSEVNCLDFCDPIHQELLLLAGEKLLKGSKERI